MDSDNDSDNQEERMNSVCKRQENYTIMVFIHPHSSLQTPCQNLSFGSEQDHRSGQSVQEGLPA